MFTIIRTTWYHLHQFEPSCRLDSFVGEMPGSLRLRQTEPTIKYLPVTLTSSPRAMASSRTRRRDWLIDRFEMRCFCRRSVLIRWMDTLLCSDDRFSTILMIERNILIVFWWLLGFGLAIGTGGGCNVSGGRTFTSTGRSTLSNSSSLKMRFSGSSFRKLISKSAIVLKLWSKIVQCHRL